VPCILDVEVEYSDLQSELDYAALQLQWSENDKETVGVGG